MGRSVVLNSVDHHDLRVRLGHSAAWGDAVNLCLVAPTEFEEVQREYPILFRRDGEGWQAVALLGLDADENLFLDGQTWAARYVPAMRRRAPFQLGRSATAGEGADPVLHIDLDDPRVSRTEGAPLFLPAGGHAPYLEHALRIMRALHVGREVAPAMFDAFTRHGLIAPVKLEITVDEALGYDVPDVFTVAADRLAALDGAALEALNRAGFLRLAFMVSASLANVTHLIDRKRQRMAAARGGAAA